MDFELDDAATGLDAQDLAVIDNEGGGMTAPEESMDDTIRNTLREIQARDAAPTEDDAAAAQRARDAAGRFAKTDPAVADPAATDPAVVDPAVNDPALIDPRVNDPAVNEDRAPNGWKREVAAEWTKLPPAVRAEINRREGDFHKGIQQYRAAAGFATAMEKVITPYAATLRQLGIGADRAVAELMAADHVLRNGAPNEKVAYFAQLARNYGIDLGQTQEAYQRTPAEDPRVAQLERQLGEVTGYLRQSEQAKQNAADEALNSEIAAFRSDPVNKHFDLLRPQMSALLASGAAANLREAYDQAMGANPATRAELLKQQDAQRRAALDAEAKRSREAASVNTRRRAPAVVSEFVGKTMEETIRHNLRRMTGG